MKAFIFPDIHWKMRDLKAMEVATRAHRWFRPDITVIGGDLLDCTPFSRHPPSAADLDLAYDFLGTELEPASKFLDDLQKVSPRLEVLAGNHDEWFDRWCARDGRAGMSLRGFRPSTYLMRGRKNASWYPFDNPSGLPRSVLKLNPGLIVIHGWACNKYAAERHLSLAAPYSVIFHHTHRMETRTCEDLDGKTRLAMSAGCLCSKAPAYKHGTPADWVHGFSVVYLGKKTFTAYPVPILSDGSVVMPCGKEIRA